MNKTENITARVRYSKDGLIRFIGHLDTVGFFIRAIRKGNIKSQYSRGFSPRMLLSFAPPLPLGYTSDCEYFDLKLAEECDQDYIKETLQSNVPDGITIKDVKILKGIYPSLAMIIDRAEYEIDLPRDLLCDDEKIKNFLSRKEIKITKFKREKKKEIDIRPSILNLQIIDGTEDSTKLKLEIDLSNSEIATPKDVLDGLLQSDSRTIIGLRIHRKRLFSSSGLI